MNQPWVSPPLRALYDHLADTLPDSEDLLQPIRVRLVGTGSDGMDDARARMGWNWLIRVYTSAWLSAGGVDDEATRLRELDLSSETALAEAIEVARDIRDLAEVNAVAATGSPRGGDHPQVTAAIAVETAVQQAIDTTPVEGVVATVWADFNERDSVAWDAWEHLTDAVYAAAIAVAWAAAAADPDHAGQAAADALAPVVADLRQSALILLESMVAPAGLVVTA